MAEAVFLVEVAAPMARVREALVTFDGLTAWWTDDVELSEGALSLGFTDAPERFALRVDSQAEERVQWTSVGDFPPHWRETQIVWNLMAGPDPNHSRVFFQHLGFAEPDPMLGHTSMVWGNLMNSLKGYCESGVRSPMLNG